MTEQVVLAWVDPGHVSGRFMDSVMRVMLASQDAVAQGIREDYVVPGFVRLESGPRIASARNSLVRLFLEQEKWKDVEWLLMLDADMTFDPDVIPELFRGTRDAEGNVKRPVVGGLCFGGGHGSIMPTMYRMVDPKENGGNPTQLVVEWDPGDAVQVDATGAACLLVHRHVYEGLAELHPEPAPWFHESTYNGMEFGEDWTFCMKVRMQNIPIYVNTGAKVGHMKQVELNEAMWRTGEAGLNQMGRVKEAPGAKLIIPDGADVMQLSRALRRHPERLRR